MRIQTGQRHSIRRRIPRGIQITIMITFMVVSVLSLTFTSVVLYSRFVSTERTTILQNTDSRLEQTRHNLEDYLVSMRQISDAVYYNIITEIDIADAALGQEMGLIYESYRDSLVSIALYDENGSLITASPVASQKRDPDVTHQQWFMDAMAEIENVHFGTPHVQNLFDDGRGRYPWVISLSRAVDITDGNRIRTGVLVVDMNYDSISELMEQLNENGNGQYYYLCDSTGNLIYHPRKVLISEGLATENNAYAVTCADGYAQDILGGEQRDLVLCTVGYTGWRLIGVIPERTYTSGNVNLQYFVLLVGIIVVMLLLVVNRLVAGRISRPILMLDDAVKAHEAGGHLEITGSGPLEVRHLAGSIQQSYEQIDALMCQIVEEQNERRRSEFDALQSQINPHFLYNTLDSITWMIEGGQNEAAAQMISALGRLMRISLSKGHTIISLADELQHSRSYMNIQLVRYRERFAVTFDLAEDILQCCSVKLILQPILENAIYYGVGNMDEDDGGCITVTGRRVHMGMESAAPATDAAQHTGNAARELAAPDASEDPSGVVATCDVIEIRVADNGLGMTQEMADRILTRQADAPKHGSGVGLVNVNARIQLIYGKEYGLRFESEPDLGTTVTIWFPAVPFTEENRTRLEDGGHAAALHHAAQEPDDQGDHQCAGEDHT